MPETVSHSQTYEYRSISTSPKLAALKQGWQPSSANSECSLHQLAPYIGKLKTSLARALIESFSSKGETIIDPFAGSGVVPLEALLLGRGAIGNDINPYAATLTKAKMFPVTDAEAAHAAADRYINCAKQQAASIDFKVHAPLWVQSFFHPKTLAEAKCLAEILIANQEWFLLANLLGILHHQRPGFLSYPSSHLVPYLRDKKYPRLQYPELYEYRDLGPRFHRKLDRTFKRFLPFDPALHRQFSEGDICDLVTDKPADIAVTSPPYMNALDYGRDNRLRLWLIGIGTPNSLDQRLPQNAMSFSSLMELTARIMRRVLRPRGTAILIVGEIRRESRVVKSEAIVRQAFEQSIGGWKLVDTVSDLVPDIRRSRRACRATKTEWVLVFKRTR